MIDTALLIAGALTASCYFQASTADEREVRELVEMLYLRIDWRWAQDGGETIRQGWKPECGFLHYGWGGYSEAIVLYVLALGSPSHPIAGACYHAWTIVDLVSDDHHSTVTVDAIFNGTGRRPNVEG